MERKVYTDRESQTHQPETARLQLGSYLQALHWVFFSLANMVKPSTGQASQNCSVQTNKKKTKNKVQLDVETVSLQKEFCSRCSTHLIRLI